MAALLEERRGYAQREDAKRLAAVDAELAKLGVSVADDGTVDLPADVTEADVPAGYETATADLTEVETATRKPAAKKTAPKK